MNSAAAAIHLVTRRIVRREYNCRHGYDAGRTRVVSSYGARSLGSSSRSAVDVPAADGREGAGDLRRELRQRARDDCRAMKHALLMAAIALAAGCSKSAEPTPSAVAGSSAPTAAPESGDYGARIVGRVQASGLAVVALEPKSVRTFPQQAETPVMDQVGQTFGPELLLVRTGEPVEFRNSDDTLHNVNVKDEQTREQAFNVAIPTGGVYEHTFKKDGFYRVPSDIHPATAPPIFAASTPYTAGAESDGHFEFAGVPSGSWTITAFTGGRRLQKDLDVKGGVTEVVLDGDAAR